MINHRFISCGNMLTLLLTCGYLTSLLGQGQNSSDSLFELIVQNHRDSIELVIPLADQYLQNTESVDSNDIIQVIKYQGRAHRTIGNYVKSIDRFMIVHSYATAHGDSLLIAEASDQIGIMNVFMGNMMEGQKYVIETANIYQSIGTDQQKADSNNGLAIFYNDLGQKEKAVEIYRVALDQYITIDDTLGRANIHANLGMLYLDEQKFDLAEKHILKQGHLDSLMNSLYGLGFFTDFMGTLRKDQGRYVEALEWFKKSFAIRLKLSSHYNLAESRAGLASSYIAMGQYDEAIEQAQLILKDHEEHQSLSQQMIAFKYLSKAYEKKNNLGQALAFHKKYMLMSDSIYNRDLIQEIENKDAQYEKAVQDKEILRLDLAHEKLSARLRYKSRLLWFSLGALFIISSLIFMLLRLYNKVMKQKDQLADAVAEKDLLLREIHHRVKNNLQLISSLLSLQGRSIDDKMAQQAILEGQSRVRSMALIHQDLYNKKDLTSVGVQSYLEKLTRELFLTYSVNSELIELKLNISPIDLDVDSLIPIGLIINELLTNSLKYAFPNNTSGVIDLSLTEQGDQLILEVSDNGVGFKQHEIRKGSFGTTLIRSLTKQLSGTYDISGEDGTNVIIAFEDYRK